MEKWLQGLDVWAWKYRDPPRGYRGAHFTALPSSCDPLLRAVDVVEAEGPGSRRSVPLRPLRPEFERQITGGMRYKTFRRLRIIVEPGGGDLEQYCVNEQGDQLLIVLTPGHLSDIRWVFESVSKGIGDGSVRPTQDRREGLRLGSRDRESLDLWYWPCFGHIAATLVPKSLKAPKA